MRGPVQEMWDVFSRTRSEEQNKLRENTGTERVQDIFRPGDPEFPD
jgi:hypothetical protein